MAQEPSPAFQFYPKDFLTDSHVAPMTVCELGAYMMLICHCWMDYSVPTDLDVLAKMCHVSPRGFAKLWPRLQPCFTVVDGRLIQPRVEKERRKQLEYRELKSTAGKHGGRPKAEVKQNESTRQAEVKQNESTRQANESSPSPSPSPSSVQNEKSTRSVADERAKEESDVGKRAGRLLAHYADWYARRRNGAKLCLIQNTLDFQGACSLCATWDDATLEKLAAIVLTTDDAFIAGTDRGFKIFVMKASWADDRLRQWEQEHGVTA